MKEWKPLVEGFVGGFTYGLKTARLENAGVSAPAAAPSLAADASAAGLMFQRAAGNDKEATSLVADLLTQLAGPNLSPAPRPPTFAAVRLWAVQVLLPPRRHRLGRNVPCRPLVDPEALSVEVRDPVTPSNLQIFWGS